VADGITFPQPAPTAQLLDEVGVLSVRMLADDTAAPQALERAGLPWVNVPGEWAGSDPFVVWRSPHERLVLGRRSEVLQAVRQALVPGLQASALAVDLSEAMAVTELLGPALDDWLAHLVDAHAIPRQPGLASGCRMADVPVLLLRLRADCVWLAVERPLLPHINHWLAFAHYGAFAGAA
jgi:hypothetical protein